MKKTGLINREYVNTVIRERKTDIHKGDCGKVLVMAGSKGMSGAATLCGRGALRSGAGLVRYFVPEELFPILQITVPEATCISRSVSDMDWASYDAIALGPGLGDDAENEKIIIDILKNYEGTLVIDADGLNTLAKSGRVKELRKSCCKKIITPHIGEAARLLGVSADMLPKDKKEVAIALTKVTGAVSVVKGEGTAVADPDSFTYTNTTGNPGMATGGAGDVLTGVIAAFAGQGLKAVDSAAAGVFVHGYAGDLAAAELGQYGITAGDIADFVSLAIKEITGK